MTIKSWIQKKVVVDTTIDARNFSELSRAARRKLELYCSRLLHETTLSAASERELTGMLQQLCVDQIIKRVKSSGVRLERLVQSCSAASVESKCGADSEAAGIVSSPKATC